MTWEFPSQKPYYKPTHAYVTNVKHNAMIKRKQGKNRHGKTLYACKNVCEYYNSEQLPFMIR